MPSSLYLASQSPRRQEILKELGIRFKVVLSEFQESKDIIDPLERLEYNACGKAINTDISEGIVLGVDTIGLYKGVALEKPVDKQNAFDMLSMLSGNTHEVWSGVCFYNVEKKTKEYFNVMTKVTFYKLSEQEIWDYIETGEPMDKAAAYGIQGKGKLLVKNIEGDYWNVVGLPMEAVRRIKN